jgi:hypothetical protein
MTPFPRDRATGRMRLSTDFEVDLSEFPIDEPIPPHLIPEKANFHQTYFAQIAEMARRGMTLRQIYMLLFHTMPGGLRDFVEHVVPELQKRGMMRSAYTGSSLRDHLGLKRPENRYVSMAQTKAQATSPVA